MNGNILIWGAIGILVAVVILIISGKARVALQIAARGVFGIIGILGINWMIGFLGLYLALPGLNFLTIAAVAFLGLPGLVAIYGMGLIM